MTKGALLIVVNDRNKVLLQHKDAGAPTHPNQWCLFGGGIETGENAQQAIHREFIEELEWKINECEHFRTYPENDVFYTKTTKDAHHLRSKLHEGSDLGYFSEKEIMSMDVALPHRQALIDYFAVHHSFTVHFVCRGNACRSIIAEAYLKSFNITGLRVISSGSFAADNKANNRRRYFQISQLLKKHGLQSFTKKDYGEQLSQELLNGSDIVICMNHRVFDGSSQSFTLPPKTYYWDITDIGEAGRIATSIAELARAEESIFNEIVKEVDRLVDSIKLAH